MLTTRRAVAPPTAEPQEDERTADEVLTAELSSRRTDPRGSADLAPQRLDWRSAPAPIPGRERRPRPWTRMLAGAALVMIAAPVWIGVAAIASHRPHHAVSSHSATFAAASSEPGAAFPAAAKTVRSVLGTIEQQVRTAPAPHRVNPRRAHPRRRTRHVAPRGHSRPPQPHTSSQTAPQFSTGTGSQTAPTPSASTAQSGGGSSSGGVGSSSGPSQQPSSASTPSSTPAQPTGAAGALGPIGSPNG